VLQAHGGTLHSKAEAYSALRELVGSLGDRCGCWSVLTEGLVTEKS
jgi:hypothetical protein